MATQLNSLSAVRAAKAIEAGEISAEALAISCLDRINDRDTLPFGIKDVIDTADCPTEYNSPIYRGYRPKADAACVYIAPCRLRDHGQDCDDRVRKHPPEQHPQPP